MSNTARAKLFTRQTLFGVASSALVPEPHAEEVLEPHQTALTYFMAALNDYL
jgi:hypothetical protein